VTTVDAIMEQYEDGFGFGEEEQSPKSKPIKIASNRGRAIRARYGQKRGGHNVNGMHRRFQKKALYNT